MTLFRSIAIIYFCFLLLPRVSGQQQLPSPGSLQLTQDELQMLASMAADTAGGKLNIPNVFTPNGDGINDYFEVETDGVTVYEFSIFTRTGTRIFYSISPRIYWDGKSDAGLELKEGVYYYVVDETGDSHPFKKAGFIHLFR
jgi:gliding motility-associated-like protein